MDAERLAKKLARAKAEIVGLEQMIETKARDLFLSRESLRKSMEFQSNVMASMPSGLAVIDAEGKVTQVNTAAQQMLGYAEEELLELTICDFGQIPEGPEGAPFAVNHQDVELTCKDESQLPCHYSSTPMKNSDGEVEAYVCVWLDRSEQSQLEMDLRQAQKLESLGQMAAGVAHEINTPIQFVGDSLSFLKEAFDDIQEVTDAYLESRAKWSSEPQFAELSEALSELEEDADLEFIKEEAPGAFERATNGLGRVASIVKALKSFSHPGSDDAAPANLNEVLETTLTLANNEYKYVAELKIDLGELPEVSCHEGDMGQVFLNMVVNAAHAIEEKIGGSGSLGTISISSREEGGYAVFEIADTGAGIPKEVLERIYDPFFTTKDVGKGTGQGLSISHRIVVDKHGGKIEVDSQPGEGTTFRVFLPLERKAKAA